MASKKLTGRRITRACTRRRSSVMARWPATLITCEIANDVIACTSVAPPTASAIGRAESVRRLPTTSSIRNLVLAGKHETGERG